MTEKHHTRNQKTDRRVRKTKKLLRQGITTLLQEKPLCDITVRELADLADINRGTFYLHYKDIFDMVKQLEQDMLEEFHSIINTRSEQELTHNTCSIFEDIFRFLCENSDMCPILLGPNGDLLFVSTLKTIIRDECLKDWIKLFPLNDKEHFDYQFAFIISGTIGLMNEWIQHGMKEPPEEMAQLTKGVISRGMQSIMES